MNRHMCFVSRKVLLLDFLKKSPKELVEWKQNETAAGLLVKFRSRVIQRRCLGTSARRGSSVVSGDNIIRSHLPDIVIPTNTPFHEYIFEKCDLYKDLPALTEFLNGRTYTYSDVKQSAIKVASALHRLGYKKGHIVLCFSTNNIDVCILMLACASLGVWYSAANPTFTADELGRQVTDSGILAVFTNPQLAATVKKALDSKQCKHHVKHLFVFGASPGLRPFQTLLDDDGRAFPDVDIDPQKDVYLLPYSSGTTGLPKGVMLTHYNVLANCLQIQPSAPVSVEEKTLGLLPLYHIFGMVIVQYCVLQSGACLITLPKFDPETFLKCIQDAKIEMANLVPSIVNFLAKHPMVSKYDITTLRRIFCSAAPLGDSLTQEFLRRHAYGVSIAQGYGMTEASPATNIDATYRAGGSVGTLVVNTLGKIVDKETNRLLGPRELGEYCVKGPQVMKGYFNNRKATKETITPDGWLHTGDIGYYTEDGNVYICDRIKELIKYKGSQVPPAELESVLLEHPGIADVAVIGVPDELAGELAKAFVVKKPGVDVTEEEIVHFMKDKMAPSKRLYGGVQFINEIPRNASGKILRRSIKEKYTRSVKE